ILPLRQLASTEPPPGEDGPQIAYLSVAGVTKRFRSHSGIWLARSRRKQPALSDVSLAVPRGSSVGIVGESGSGKTTLVRCIVGLEQPDSGSVTIGGINVTNASRGELRAVRRHVQIIFQDPYTSLNP